VSSTTSVYALVITPEDVYKPYHIELGDGLVFHVTPPGGEEYGFIGYPETGLYRDGELIYTVGDRHFFDSLFFSNDAMSFLEISPWNGNERIAVRFYNQGVFVHQYLAQDFLSDEVDLRPCFVLPNWHVRDQTHHDRTNNILQITTVEGRKFTFDLTTGLVMPNEYDFNISMIGLGIAIVVFALLLFIIIKRKRTH